LYIKNDEPRIADIPIPIKTPVRMPDELLEAVYKSS
jgi:hypothetical protein